MKDLLQTLTTADIENLFECARLQIYNQEPNSNEQKYWEQLTGKLRDAYYQRCIEDLDAAAKELGVQAEEACENTPTICSILMPSGLKIDIDGSADNWEAVNSLIKDLKQIAEDYL